jgi:DNA-binding NarL/FixJ family response regulator
MRATVLIAEKNKLILEALESTISLLGFTVVGTTSKRSDLEELVFTAKPDLLVYDMHLSNNGKAGLADLKPLKEQLPKMKILGLSFHEAGHQFAAEILNAGFDGYWNKFNSREMLVEKLNDFFPDYTSVPAALIPLHFGKERSGSNESDGVE